ncbi:hypothetical protein PPGU19_098500 (plasmid) [Paraburkholderia sp. PGU19]|nr:hypothetical protein PPGU19_098500 [Paraburkholderia sp. PGU19]
MAYAPEARHHCVGAQLSELDAGAARVAAADTICRSLFIQARSALKKELLEHLRRPRAIRSSRYHTQKTDDHGRILDAVSIGERPATVEDRAVPRHWEGDLLCGSGGSQIATLVRTPAASYIKQMRTVGGHMPVRTILHDCAGRDDPSTERPGYSRLPLQGEAGAMRVRYHGRTHVDPNDALSADLLFQRRFAVAQLRCRSGENGALRRRIVGASDHATSAAEVSMLREAEDA